MLKALSLSTLIITGIFYQDKRLGSLYVCEIEGKGITQRLQLFKQDSFRYEVYNSNVDLRGKFRVHKDSLILPVGKLALSFHIKPGKLVAFNDHDEEPDWSLTKVQ